jgi:protein-S-isoprenylcysteine O-methyltransferase Ste14
VTQQQNRSNRYCAAKVVFISECCAVPEGEDMFRRVTSFVYGVVCYLIFLATFLYAVGFIGNFGVPKSIDSGREIPFVSALAINAALLAVFALQHSVMARQWFKKAWTRIVPPPVERSTYVLFSSLALILLFWKWQPMGGAIWSIENRFGWAVLEGLYGFGWLTVLITTFLINHFDLFGLRQVWLYLVGKPYTGSEFRTPGPYRLVRHPLYVGWLLVAWAAPVMTAAHLVYAIGSSAYILIAIQFEERDLVRFHREYAEYRRRVPMLLPNGPRRRASDVKVGSKLNA